MQFVLSHLESLKLFFPSSQVGSKVNKSRLLTWAVKSNQRPTNHYELNSTSISGSLKFIQRHVQYNLQVQQVSKVRAVELAEATYPNFHHLHNLHLRRLHFRIQLVFRWLLKVSAVESLPLAEATCPTVLDLVPDISV